MVIPNGVCVHGEKKMTKQYTFKTTKETSWIEEILDRMDMGDRSKFIRTCITTVLDRSHNCHTIVTPMSDLPVVKQEVNPEEALDKLGLLYD